MIVNDRQFGFIFFLLSALGGGEVPGVSGGFPCSTRGTAVLEDLASENESDVSCGVGGGTGIGNSKKGVGSHRFGLEVVEARALRPPILRP